MLSAAGQGASGLAGQISSQVSNQALATVRREIEAALREAGVNPQRVNLEQEAREIGRQVIQGELSEQDLERTATEMARRTAIPPEQARARLQEWQQRGQRAMDQAEQQARQAAEVAANTASQAGIWSFVALLIGGVAGAIGGVVGTPRDLY